MKLVTYQHNGAARTGVMKNETEIVDVSAAGNALTIMADPAARQRAAAIAADPAARSVALDGVRLRAPLDAAQPDLHRPQLHGPLP